MRKAPLFAATAVLLLGSANYGLAQEHERSPGKSGETPGHEMQEHGSVKGAPGASGYTPGHDADDKTIKRDRDETTGSGDHDDKKFKRDRENLKMKKDRD